MMPLIKTIVSGGQTGANRAALDWAIEHDIPHGGWCPKGRLAEDGLIPPQYNLTETPSRTYPQRTEWNVRDSDGTVIFSLAPVLTGELKKTADYAKKHGKPVIYICPHKTFPAELRRGWIEEHAIRVLNVAGPRGSMEPRIGAFVSEALGNVLDNF